MNVSVVFSCNFILFVKNLKTLVKDKNVVSSLNLDRKKHHYHNN